MSVKDNNYFEHRNEPRISLNETWYVQLWKEDNGHIAGLLYNREGFKLWKENYPKQFAFDADITIEPRHMECSSAELIPKEIKLMMQNLIDQKYPV